jgi:hypothetical protein
MSDNEFNKKTENQPGRESEGVFPILGIVIVGLAIYGLSRLLSNKPEQCQSIADIEESDFIDEIIRKERL